MAKKKHYVVELRKEIEDLKRKNSDLESKIEIYETQLKDADNTIVELQKANQGMVYRLHGDYVADHVLPNLHP